MTSRINYQKVNDIFQCKLILSNNKEFIIPLREDGYINATKLCQAAGKRMTKWKNSKETQELIKIFSLTKNNKYICLIRLLTNLLCVYDKLYQAFSQLF